MKRNRTAEALALTVTFSMACSLVQTIAGGRPVAGSSTVGPTFTGSVRAQATSPISVELAWDPVVGASQYTVKVSQGDLPAVTLANLPGTATNYEDFPAPPDATLTYRVTALTSGETRQAGTATLKTPQETANPLTVKVNYEQNSFVIPTPDPNKPGLPPSSYLPPGFDPNNPDLSLLQPGPKTTRKDIGSEGGTMEMTSAKGVKYTLTVPSRAVAFSIPFGLTPVDSIDGLPLSGGLIGAVRVEPEGIEFAYPLVLEVSLPAEAAPVPVGQVVVGFAVSPPSEGGEFYFLPSRNRSSTGMGRGGHLARVRGERALAGPLGGLRLVDGRVVGWGAGTPADVRNTVKSHPPSSSKNRTTSKVAAEDEELAPVPPLRDRELERISDEAAGAGDTDQYLQALNDFQAYLESGPKSGAGEERVWDEILVNTQVMFNRQKDKCLTRDGFAAAGVAARMAFADEGTFWSEFRDRFVKKYGQDKLDEALAYAKRCKLALKVDSNLSWSLESAGVSLGYDITAEVKPLLLSYESDPQSPKYGVSLKGYALLYPSKVEVKTQGCQQTILNPFPTEFVRIGLRPKFDDAGNLSNFEVVDFGGGGGRAKLTQKCGDSASSALLTVPSGGTWGGLFVDARRGNVAFAGFGVSSPPPSSGVIATRSFPDLGAAGSVSGATITENTTFKLILGK